MIAPFKYVPEHKTSILTWLVRCIFIAADAFETPPERDDVFRKTALDAMALASIVAPSVLASIALVYLSPRLFASPTANSSHPHTGELPVAFSFSVTSGCSSNRA